MAAGGYDHYGEAEEEPLEGDVEGHAQQGAYLEGEGGQDEEEEGFAWTYGAASMPAPPKRSGCGVEVCAVFDIDSDV